MLNSVDINGRSYSLRSNGPVDISIPLRFNGPQPNAFGVEPATSVPCAAGDLIGDTRQGGSCNFEQYTFIAHCNGTHTECVGHITRKRISIQECLGDVMIPAVLTTIEPSYAADIDESYSIPIDNSDRLIMRTSLEKADFKRTTMLPLSNVALIVRTLPNDDRKLTRQYVNQVPPYFTTEAMEYIVDCGFKHLLVDLPSIDRMYDEGRLSNHRLFWNVDQGSFETSAVTRVESTITELAYIPNDIPDDLYLLNLQIAPFASDASPSRPLLFTITQN